MAAVELLNDKFGRVCRTGSIDIVLLDMQLVRKIVIHAEQRVRRKDPVGFIFQFRKIVIKIEHLVRGVKIRNTRADKLLILVIVQRDRCRLLVGKQRVLRKFDGYCGDVLRIDIVAALGFGEDRL